MDVRLDNPLLRKAMREISRRQRPMYTAAQLAARDWPLKTFLQHAWPIIEPATPLVWGWHLEAVCDHVQALLNGELAHRNLLICVPPGSAKSTVVSIAAPAWMWIRNPAWRATFASGNPSVATRDSVKCRTILDSVWYRNTFGITWGFSEDQNQKTYFENSATGFRQAISTGSRVTGSRPHALFVDDPLDAADAYSKAERDAVLNWWSQAFANRLADLSHGTRCVIMQRLHPEDLAGHLIANEREHWEVLVIPQEWEESRRCTTSLGWTDPRTADCELMFPARFPADVVAQEKARLGSSGYAGQHQQRPTIAGGELFKADWLRRLKADDLPAKYSQVIISLDTAYSEKQTADYSVAMILGQFDRGVMILDVVRGRWAYPQLRSVVAELAVRWSPFAVLIENKASGQSLIQSLQQETSLPVKAIDVDRDKVSRAHAVTPSFEAGRVHVPASASWMEDFMDELLSFPKASHDDQVDALVQGVSYLLSGAGQGLLAYYQGLLGEEKATAEQPKADPLDPHHVVEKVYLMGTGPTALLERAKREKAIVADI